MSPPAKLSPQRPLTHDEVRRALQGLDFSRAGTLERASRLFASRIGFDGGDLLNEAVRRALTSRSCPGDVPVDQVIAGIMRSISSTLLRSRARRDDEEVSLALDEARDWLAPGGFAVRTAEEELEIKRVRRLCADAIERIEADDSSRAALIDGIGFDLRGRELADFLGVSLRELATMRKALKRRAARIWPEVSHALAGTVPAKTEQDSCPPQE